MPARAGDVDPLGRHPHPVDEQRHLGAPEVWVVSVYFGAQDLAKLTDDGGRDPLARDGELALDALGLGDGGLLASKMCKSPLSGARGSEWPRDINAPPSATE